MKTMRPMSSLALAFTLAVAGQAYAGGQQIQVEVAKDARSLLVRTYHCGTPAEIAIVGSAEGIVNGQPKTVPLTLTRTAEADVFSVARQWPADGAWVLTFTNEKSAFVNAIVELVPGAALQIASQESSRDKLSRGRISAALRRLASR